MFILVSLSWHGKFRRNMWVVSRGLQRWWHSLYWCTFHRSNTRSLFWSKFQPMLSWSWMQVCLFKRDGLNFSFLLNFSFNHCTDPLFSIQTRFLDLSMESSHVAHVLRMLHMEMERSVIVWKDRIIHLLFNTMFIIQGMFD